MYDFCKPKGSGFHAVRGASLYIANAASASGSRRRRFVLDSIGVAIRGLQYYSFDKHSGLSFCWLPRLRKIATRQTCAGSEYVLEYSTGPSHRSDSGSLDYLEKHFW